MSGPITGVPQAEQTSVPITEPTPIGLCADDYAQHAGVDDAVCALLAGARLSAVSCMSGAPRWLAQSAPRLRELAPAHADIGLHLNLTERFGAPQASLPALIARTYCGGIDRAALRVDFARQFDLFEQGMGRVPDFIDGHQHVHQLPGVRDVLASLLQERYAGAKPWVRSTVPAPGIRGGKSALLQVLGGAALTRRLRALGVANNAGFGGVYGFDAPDYAARFDAWLAHARRGMLLMCHPGSSLDAHDPISAQRLVEYQFFASDAFPSVLAARHVTLVPLSSILRPS